MADPSSCVKTESDICSAPAANHAGDTLYQQVEDSSSSAQKLGFIFHGNSKSHHFLKDAAEQCELHLNRELIATQKNDVESLQPSVVQTTKAHETTSVTEDDSRSGNLSISGSKCSFSGPFPLTSSPQQTSSFTSTSSPSLDTPGKQELLLSQLLNGPIKDGGGGDGDGATDFLEEALYGPSLYSRGSSPHQWSIDEGSTKEPALQASLSGSRSSEKGQTTSETITCLLITENTSGDEALRADIKVALHASPVRISRYEDAIEVCNDESFQFIWLHLTATIVKSANDVVNAIRYSSKKDKGVHIIAVWDQQPEDECRVQGVDDVYVLPLATESIRLKYTKLGWITPHVTTARPIDHPNQQSSTSHQGRESINTPESTVSGASFPTIGCSQSSTCDSACGVLDMELGVPSLDGRDKSPLLSDSLSVRSSSNEPLSWCRVEHATKEKQRRERIKDSCDQLRVLLPYVRGRKTDMASILEMTVDYLKIVNAALPQDFQTQVIDIMSGGSGSLERLLGTELQTGKVSKRARSRSARAHSSASESSNSSKVGRMSIGKPRTDPVDNSHGDVTSKTHQMVTRSLSKASVSFMARENSSKVVKFNNRNMTSGSNNSNILNTNVNSKSVNSSGSNNSLVLLNKRASECPPINKAGSSKPKRPHLPLSNPAELGPTSPPSVLYLPSGTDTTLKESKPGENLLDDPSSQGSLSYTGLHYPHLFTDGDISANRMFSGNHMSGNDIFSYTSPSPMNVPTNRGTTADRGEVGAGYGGMTYFDGAYYHYYQNMHHSNNGNYFLPSSVGDYVNPNAVLPVNSYTARVSSAFAPARKMERGTCELERYVAGETDIFNSSSNNHHSNNNNNNNSSNNNSSNCNNNTSIGTDNSVNILGGSNNSGNLLTLKPGSL